MVCNVAGNFRMRIRALIFVIGLFCGVFANEAVKPSEEVILNRSVTSWGFLDHIFTENSPRVLVGFSNSIESFFKGLKHPQARVCSVALGNKRYYLAFDSHEDGIDEFSVVRWITDEEEDFSNATCVHLPQWNRTDVGMSNYFVIPLAEKERYLVCYADWVIREERDPRPSVFSLTYEFVELQEAIVTLNEKKVKLISGKRFSTLFNYRNLPFYVLVQRHTVVKGAYPHVIYSGQPFLFDGVYYAIERQDVYRLKVNEQSNKPCLLSVKNYPGFYQSLRLKSQWRTHFVRTQNNKPLPEDALVPSGNYEIIQMYVKLRNGDGYFWAIPQEDERRFAIKENVCFDIGKSLVVSAKAEQIGKIEKVYSILPDIRTEKGWQVIRLLDGNGDLAKMTLTVTDQDLNVVFTRQFTYQNNEIEPLNVAIPEGCERLMITIAIEKCLFKMDVQPFYIDIVQQENEEK